ncbi:esterase/lipase family protein [Allosalinactinospora lopnorensis]|uniref:esterase/lipase family protein n=1 Tax=Allosalinactinospora lopnorensis TaxID=1352348 RepID=UPI000698C958|nr:alpha/beta fold hydrolase [Allosalinactinospora lopnorensis]
MSPLKSGRARWPRLAVLLLSLAGLFAVNTAPAAYASEPNPVAEAQELAAPDVPGANDWECEPTAEHPNPVVLVHGLLFDAALSWFYMSPRLAGAGYCVFALNYGEENGVAGVSPMEESAVELASFVTGVKAATGAEEVDLVGHSQGGLMPRWYLRFEDGAAHVGEFVGLAPPNHGSDINFIDLLPPDMADALCGSCRQFSHGSEFLTTLNEGRDVEPGVDYTTVNTRYDEAVVPYTRGFLDGPAEQVTNVVLQDACWFHLGKHATPLYDRVTLQWVLNALGRSGPADPDFRPSC